MCGHVKLCWKDDHQGLILVGNFFILEDMDSKNGLNIQQKQATYSASKGATGGLSLT